MKLLLRLLIGLWALAGVCGQAARATPPDLTRPIVVFGDSLSAGYGLRTGEGWVSLLAQRMAAAGYGQPVVNASVSGETTTGGLSRIGHLLSTRHPAVVVLELGANDALRGLPPEVIEGNLIALTQAAQKAGARVLLVGTPLPANYGAEYGRSVARAFVNAARRTKTPLVPSLFSRIEVREENFQADRLHPVAAVQDRMLDCVWPSLQPLLLKTTP